MLKKNTVVKLVIFAIIIGIIAYFFCNGDLYDSIKNIFSSPASFKDFVAKQGAFAPVVFFFIQIGQVIISPIPGNLTALAGGAMFGGWTASLLSGSAIIIGSVIAFFLARAFGRPLVIKLIGKSIFDKYSNVFIGKSALNLFILFFLPFFPDDALCFLAGMSNISVRLFLALTIVGRLPSIIFASFAGDGVISLSTTSWIVVGIISVIAIFLSLRYSKNIEKWLYARQN